ncbi:hypothetical protein F503_04418 [Ophiostoma piceae UAMH 11346]|uniref:Duf1941 family protein n=1 Tax=Ophiostoma piceae (strain UAMH 11346) TaxID=1262450 RepID=S3CA88_OPHP1|nr:hypothetical protein F503_04418 [Ophiostoma piceae UAMH 11346]
MATTNETPTVPATTTTAEPPAVPAASDQRQEGFLSADQMDVDTEDAKEVPEDPAIARIEQLLRAKDDTSRFVALALLKAVLDNQDTAKAASSESLLRLWKALPVKFLDKLLRAGLHVSPSTSAQSQGSTSAATSASPQPGPASTAHMRDLAVAVLHTFAVRILPPDRRGDARLTGRIPLLVESLLNAPSEAAPSTSPSTTSPSPAPENVTTLILQTLATLVGQEQGAAVFYKTVDDYSPLVELASSQPLVLDILLTVWLYGFLAAAGRSSVGPDTSNGNHNITETLQATLPKLVAAFKGTDGITLLDFITKLLRGALFISSESTPSSYPNTDLMPSAHGSMVWLRPIVGFIRRLAANRPTARSRAAYTHAANTLIQVFPGTAEDLLFGDDGSSTPENGSFANLFINLLLVDLRATLPALLSQINNKDSYVGTASRLASAYDVLSAFVAYLMQSMEDSDGDGGEDEAGGHASVKLALSAENLLRFRTTMSETMSVTAEYLRDRWDAAIAGALGLHPDARTGMGSGIDGSRTATFSHALDAAGLPLTWDSADDEMIASRDPLVLAAIRTLSLWLREDENTTLRREALGLVDMFTDLYSAPASARSQDIRLPVIDALEGISYIDLQDGSSDGGGGDEAGLDRKAIAVLLDHGVWKMLTLDLLAILESSGELQGAQAEVEAYRGVRIAAFLLPIVVSESSGAPPEDWMDLVTRVAAWCGPDGREPASNRAIVAQCRVAALQLAAQLVHGLRPTIYRRYKHSISALRGLASQMQQSLTVPVPPRLQADLADVINMLG